MKFTHQKTNVPGGNRIVTVAEHNGKALVKVTTIPKGLAKEHRLTMKELEEYVRQAHEQHLQYRGEPSE